MLEALGFKALATTSSGFAFTPGRLDGGATLDNVAAHTRLLAAATGVPLSVDLENGYGPDPEDAAAAILRTVGTQHCVTATVEDALANPVPGVTVRFTVSGSVNTSGSATTNGAGQATFCYTGPPLPGADAITAFADTDGDGMQDLGEPSGAATKTWVLPPSTPLCEVTIADGGKITAANGDTATFSGHAQVSSSGEEVSGQQQYKDHGPAQPLTVKSINVLAVTCSIDRTEATIFGQATVDGSGSFNYRIRVKDGGTPGKGVDEYGITVSNGYASGDQTLEAGNVQITVQE